MPKHSKESKLVRFFENFTNKDPGIFKFLSREYKKREYEYLTVWHGSSIDVLKFLLLNKFFYKMLIRMFNVKKLAKMHQFDNFVYMLSTSPGEKY